MSMKAPTYNTKSQVVWQARFQRDDGSWSEWSDHPDPVIQTVHETGLLEGATAEIRVVLLPVDELLRLDSYGVDGSDFQVCRLCDAESGAGLLARGIKHEGLCPLHPENISRYAATQPSADDAPIPMLLFCPQCSMQHIDAPEDAECDGEVVQSYGWSNPPHRSHLCAGCGHIWRPADVATTGVAAIATRGKQDGSPIPVPPADARDAGLIEWAAARWRAEVQNRPLQNVHRRSLDDAWRQVIRYAGGDDVAICGPRHDDLVIDCAIGDVPINSLAAAAVDASNGEAGRNATRTTGDA